LPKIQYQRGVLYYQLHMLHQARDAFGAVAHDNLLVSQHRNACEKDVRLQRSANRRSGFDENRSFDEGLLVQLDEKIDASVLQGYQEILLIQGRTSPAVQVHSYVSERPSSLSACQFLIVGLAVKARQWRTYKALVIICVRLLHSQGSSLSYWQPFFVVVV
jgi:hypothetical protein